MRAVHEHFGVRGQHPHQQHGARAAQRRDGHRVAPRLECGSQRRPAAADGRDRGGRPGLQHGAHLDVEVRGEGERAGQRMEPDRVVRRARVLGRRTGPLDVERHMPQAPSLMGSLDRHRAGVGADRPAAHVQRPVRPLLAGRGRVERAAAQRAGSGSRLHFEDGRAGHRRIAAPPPLPDQGTKTP